MSYRYIDVHSHVALDHFGSDQDEVIRSMREQGIATITVGVDLATSTQAALCAEAHENVFATVGLHPDEGRQEVFDAGRFDALAAHPKVVAVGECGIDFYGTPAQEHAREAQRQREQFREQIAFAVKHGKPLMLHGRPSKGTMDAYADMLEVLTEAKARSGDALRGNVHFFVGTPEVAERFFELGFSVSFSGVVTFSHDYDEAVKAAPPTLLHAETDSPFAAPAPHRGTRNDPRLLPLIAARLAKLRGVGEEELRVQLLSNAKRLFGLSLPTA